MTFKHTSTLISTIAVVLATMLSTTACAADGRIGLAEEFDSFDGWSIMNPEKEDFEKMGVQDGKLLVDTWIGSFGGAHPEGQKPMPATCSLVKQYDVELDLDKYRYMIMKTDRKSMYSIVYLRWQEDDREVAKQVHVGYSTGVIAQDLSQIGIGGTKKLKVELEIMNTAEQPNAPAARPAKQSRSAFAKKDVQAHQK